MKMGLRLLPLLAPAGLAAWLSLTALAAPPREPIETRVLIDGKTTGGWQAVESALTTSRVDGMKVLLFRGPVDWHAGEPDYPIGWPRIATSLPPDQGDWRGWDQIRLRVLPRTGAGSFPYWPLGITIQSGEKGGWEKDVQALQSGEWQDVIFDLCDLPFPDRVRHVGIFISEDKYADGTMLEFSIARLELLRYTAPTLVDFRPITDLAFADAKALAARVKLAGVPQGKTVPTELRLMRGKQVVATRRAPTPAGEMQLFLPLPAHLSPGDYTISATSGGRTLSSRIRLIASPWQEMR
jgi:hypothetical protein